MHLRCTTAAIASAVLLAVGALPPPLLGQDELTYEKVIENLRANEALYEDLDVTCFSTYSYVSPTPHPHAVRGYRGKTRTVLQGEKLYLDYERKGEGSDGTPYTESARYAYDGAVARILEGGNVANIRDDAPADGRLFRPHRICISWPVSGTKLSDYLTVAQVDKRAAVWSLHRSDVDLDGLRCCVVRGEFHRGATADSPVNGRVDVWLASDRNYLPARLESYRNWDQPTLLPLPVSVFEITEWRESLPGRWMPASASEIAYDVRVLAETGKQVEELGTKYAVQDVKFSPAYDDAFFRDVPFPPDAVVYEVKGGEIVASYKASEAPKPSEK